jgi:hypothetical protein
MVKFHHVWARFFRMKKAMADTMKYLETLMRETRKPEAEVMAQAFQTGVRQMWRESILGRYLRGQSPDKKPLSSQALIG